MIIINFIALTLYCLLIYWLSDQSRLPTPNWFEYEDKLHHFMAYGVMAILAWKAFAKLIASKLNLLVISLAFVSFYGLTDEWHQSFVVGRNSSFWDWLADTLGGLLAVYGCYQSRVKLS